MPSRRDDRYFGRKRGSSHRAYEEMIKTYGLKEGARIWHALLNDRRKSGKTFARKARQGR